MCYRIKKKIKDKSAQALPEFALCLPLIMLMIGILITVGQMVYAKEVLQAAAQSYCRAFVTSYLFSDDSSLSFFNKHIADTKGKKQAELIMESAAMNIMLNPTAERQYQYDVKPITGWTNSEDGGPPRKIVTAKGDTYEYVEVTIYGAIETLFPVQWNGNKLTPNLTFLEAYCAMLIEKP